jgi:D-alanyl-D-alanine carboxypeptidase
MPKIAVATLAVCLAAAAGACNRTPSNPAQAQTRMAAPPAARSIDPALRAHLDALVAAYPDFLASHDDTAIVWKDGTRMPIFAGPANKTPDEIVANPGIADIFAWPYPAGAAVAPPEGGADPGRARPAAFFTKMYGDCRAGAVTAKLADVRWVGGETVKFTTVNGADKALAAAARDLAALGPAYTNYLTPAAGTYVCRVIAGTERLSMHAFAAAIDINASAGEYWRWEGTDKLAPYHDRVPIEIVRVFEKHGFIWGGRWTHFDTIHFEYRPELILAGAPRAP